MSWISLNDETPIHDEIVIAANPEIIAVCKVWHHGVNCSGDCDKENGEISYYSLEENNKFLKNVTHFMRIRNPHEALQ